MPIKTRAGHYLGVRVLEHMLEGTTDPAEARIIRERIQERRRHNRRQRDRWRARREAHATDPSGSATSERN